MKTKILPVLALAGLASVVPALAQEGLSQDIARIFAEDGMDVRPAPSVSLNGGTAIESTTVVVPGHLRSDGWSISPSTLVLDMITYSGGDLHLPQLSLPIRRTDLMLGRTVLEGFAPKGGGILDQSIDGAVIAPLTLTKEDGAFVSADRVVVEKGGEACFSIAFEGLAISVEKTLPALSRTAEPFYKGRGELLVDCAEGLWKTRSFTMQADGWGSFVARVDVAVDPAELLSIVVSERRRIDELFGPDPDVDRIAAAEDEMWMRIGDAVAIGESSFEFADGGFAAAVSSSLPDVAGIPGAQDLLIRTLIQRIGAGDLVDRIAPAAASFLASPRTIVLSVAPAPGTTASDFARGEVEPSAWTAAAQ